MKMHGKNLLKNAPILVVMLDLLYTMAQTVQHALAPTSDKPISQGIPISPEFAFGWIQVLVNGAIVMGMIWVMVQVMKMRRYTDNGECLRPTLTRAGILLMALAFGFPSVWLWFWTAVDWFQGRNTLTIDSPRYLLVAICQPYLAWVVLHILLAQQRLKRKK